MLRAVQQRRSQARIRRLEFMSVVTFVQNAIADYKSTASLVPSSRHLARAMVRPLCGKAVRSKYSCGFPMLET